MTETQPIIFVGRLLLSCSKVSFAQVLSRKQLTGAYNRRVALTHEGIGLFQ